MEDTVNQLRRALEEALAENQRLKNDNADLKVYIKELEYAIEDKHIERHEKKMLELKTLAGGEEYTVPAVIINGKVALSPSPAGHENWGIEPAGPNTAKWVKRE